MRVIPDNAVIAVIGLGYVGLPLAVEFGRCRTTIGFDIDSARIDELRRGHDRTMEVPEAELADSPRLTLTADPSDLAGADVFIVTVPTPIDAAKRPDLRPLESASRTVGGVMRPGSVVIYESTVYPGATEEVCVPIVAAESGLVFNVDFFAGYSPERINPGDKVHRLPDILKVTSGSNPEVAADVDALYREIITAGTHPAPSIRVAEAAKVIENTQRDVNVALINELAMLFGVLGIDTHDVLAAAGTKWNFLPFTPGLVGGHCIGVDPYYLTHKAQEVGHHPEVIMAGRRINDSMGPHVADEVVLLLARHGRPVSGARVLVLGLAFKENCPDVRNTRVVDIVGRLGEYAITAAVCDPWVDSGEALDEYGLSLVALDDALAAQWDAVVLAVAHEEFVGLAPTVRAAIGDGVVYDVKGAWPRELVDGRL